MSNFKFWSESEIKALITAIEKFQSVSKASEWLAPKIQRSYGTIYQKGNSLVNTGVVSSPKKKKPAKITGVVMPKGFSFDFVPTRAEMTKDHVKLYF